MKRLLVLFSFIFLICLTCSCSTDTKPSEIENLLSDKQVSETNSNTPDVIHDDNVFVSVWPDELPKNKTNEMFPDSGRPIQYWIEIEPGKWTPDYDYTSMYLYDFPDPVPYFNQFGRSFLLEKKIIIFKYNKLSRTDDGIDETVAITKEDFDLFIDNLIAADYTDNSERTETTYYCEKYGVGITIVLADVFPFADDDEKLRAFPTGVDCCYVRLQLIDPDYVMDLEQIKAEEYRKWLEKQ